MNKIIISLPLLVTILTAAAVAPLIGVQQDTYAQGAAFYNGINEQQQALISEILRSLLNRTADHLSIFEDSGNMFITWTDTIPVTAPDGRVFEIEQETSLTVPHNFTAENGYTYRDGTIFKPDGTELFASE